MRYASASGLAQGAYVLADAEGGPPEVLLVGTGSEVALCVAAYEQLSGRSMQALNWYVTLALWKAIVFMEGNYKRAISGSTDDPYLRSFGDGVIEIAQRAVAVSQHGL